MGYKIGKAIGNSLGRPQSLILRNSPLLLHLLTGDARAAADRSDAPQTFHLPRGNGTGPLTRKHSQRAQVDFIAEGDWGELWPNDELLTTVETAALLGKSQPAVLDWIRRNRIIGLTRKKRGFRVRRKQFGRKGEFFVGANDVISILPDHHTAWSFLTEPYPFDSGIARPRDFINKGKVELALAAADSWGADFS